MWCAPSRSSLQSGRLPVHVNTENTEPESRNANDTEAGYAGIPRSMTGIAERLARDAGYATAMSGKWDVGMATPEHTPQGRGYGRYIGYYHHANDYWTEGLPFEATGVVNVCLNQYKDLWLSNATYEGPAARYVGHGTYEEEFFTNHSLAAINAHGTMLRAAQRAHGAVDAPPPPPPPPPLFLVHAFHLLHTPLQIPQAYLDKFAFIDNGIRQHYASMVYYMDEVVGKLVAALKANDMWANTLLVFVSDNGGPIYNPAGANNFPHKGGKYSDWEGGVRTNAFVAGGFVPATARGQTTPGLVHMADWYATFCALAGIDKNDTRAAAAGLPPVDGLDVWPALRGAPSAASPRREVHLSSQALLLGRYKLVAGVQPMTGWTGPVYPNNTGAQPGFYPKGWKHDCGAGELYDVFSDPTEHENLATSRPDVLATLQARLAALNEGNFEPDRGTGDPAACAQARKYGGFYGPWVDLK